MIVSIDIETTGLDPETCQILEIGAVRIGATPFHCYVIYDQIQGEPCALHMNHNILREIVVRDPKYVFLKPQEVWYHFSAWLPHDAKITIAGKNYGSFDKQFLDRLHGWKKLMSRIASHRFIDSGNLFWQPAIDGDRLPSLQTCMRRAGMVCNVPHDAVSDAKIVLRLVQKHYEM